MQRGATEFPTEKNYTPSTGDKRVTSENKDLMDSLRKQLVDNEQMGDVCKQLHFNIEEAQATAMKDMQKRMAEMQTKHMAEMEEMKKQIAEMQSTIAKNQTILIAFSTKLDELTVMLHNFMKTVQRWLLAKSEKITQEEEEQQEGTFSSRRRRGWRGWRR